MDKRSLARQSKKSKYTIGSGESPWRVFGRTGNVIGKFSGDTAHKDVSAETAFLKYPYPAIAHTIAALEYMREMGVMYIDVLEKTSGIHYRTTVQKYFDEGEYHDGGARWGEQLKLALPKFTQTRDPEYMAHTDTDTPAYSEPSDTGEIVPLKYTSRAPRGVNFTKGGQMSLFGGG